MSMETGANAGMKNSLRTGSLWYGRTAGTGIQADRTARTGKSDFLNTFDRALKESGNTADRGQKQKALSQADRTSKNDRKQEKTRKTGSHHDPADQRIPDNAAAEASIAAERAAETAEAAKAAKAAEEPEAETLEHAEHGALEAAGKATAAGAAGTDEESGTAAVKNVKPELAYQGAGQLAELMAVAGDPSKIGGISGNEKMSGEIQSAVSGIQSAGTMADKAVSDQMISDQMTQAGIRTGLTGQENGRTDTSLDAQKQEAGRTRTAEMQTGLEGAQVLKSRNAGNTAEQSGGSTTGNGGDGKTFSDMFKNQMESPRAMESLKTGATGENQEAGPAGDNRLLEDLKRSADGYTGGFMNRMAEAGMNRGVMTVQAAADSAEPLGTPVAEQLKAGLEQGLKRELQEFTIKLKPEGLGDIIVHMATAGGKTTVRIGASNPETENLINSQMVNLKEMLEPLHAEVEEVYHNSQSAMEFAQFGQDMYQQQGRYGTSHSRHMGGSGIPEEEEDFLIDAERMIAEIRAGRLYAYV